MRRACATGRVRPVCPCSFDEGVPSAAIPLGSVAALREMCPGVALAESANVFERRETGELYLREVGVREM